MVVRLVAAALRLAAESVRGAVGARMGEADRMVAVIAGLMGIQTVAMAEYIGVSAIALTERLAARRRAEKDRLVARRTPATLAAAGRPIVRLAGNARMLWCQTQHPIQRQIQNQTQSQIVRTGRRAAVPSVVIAERAQQRNVWAGSGLPLPGVVPVKVLAALGQRKQIVAGRMPLAANLGLVRPPARGVPGIRATVRVNLRNVPNRVPCAMPKAIVVTGEAAALVTAGVLAMGKTGKV